MTTLVPYNRELPEVPGRTPFTRSDAYLEKLGAGDYAVRQGRRPSTMFLMDKLRAGVCLWYKNQASAEDLVAVVCRYRCPAGVEWQGFFEDREEDEDWRKATTATTAS